MKVVCTVAVAVLAAGRTGPAAPGSERADRLHLPHVRCTALPARCLRACVVHSAICHTTHVRTGFGREHRQRALTLDEQRLHERAVMTCLVSHHDVAIRSGVAAVQRVDRRAVNICNILLQTGRLRVLTCCGSRSAQPSYEPWLFAAGRTGPAAPGNERARLDLQQDRAR